MWACGHVSPQVSMATVREVLNEMAKAPPVEPPSSAASRKEESVVRDKGKGKKTKEAQQTPVRFQPPLTTPALYTTQHKTQNTQHTTHNSQHTTHTSLCTQTMRVVPSNS